MSYPPQPPPGQWPAGPPPQGPPPGWGPPQGPPGYPPYGGGGGGRPRRNVGVVLALVAVVVLLIGGIATTAILLANDDDGDERAGKDPSSSTSTDPTASSDAPTDATTPTGEPSSPSSPTSPTGPATPYSPTDDTDDDIHSDVKASDFPGDWNFKYGDVEHDATFRQAWNYDSCSPVEEASTLSQQRCEYAVQWTYSALGGKARITHVFLVFDTERHAKAAESKLDDEDFDLREESVFPDFVQGKWNKSVYGNVIGVTIGTTKAKVSEDELQSIVNYMNTDYRLALSFKGL